MGQQKQPGVRVMVFVGKAPAINHVRVLMVEVKHNNKQGAAPQPTITPALHNFYKGHRVPLQPALHKKSLSSMHLNYSHSAK